MSVTETDRRNTKLIQTQPEDRDTEITPTNAHKHEITQHTTCTQHLDTHTHTHL